MKVFLTGSFRVDEVNVCGKLSLRTVVKLGPICPFFSRVSHFFTPQAPGEHKNIGITR
jgi:hypothetical protein